MKSLILLSIALTHFTTIAEEQTFDARELSSLHVQNLSGLVSVSASPDQNAKVKFEKKAWAKGCELDISMQFEVLKVAVEVHCHLLQSPVVPLV